MGLIMPDFLPRRGAELLTWSKNFDQKISLDAEAYALSLEQAEQYSILHSAFAEAFRKANENSTRSPSSIQAKHDAESVLRKFARVLVGITRAAPQVSDEQISKLNLRRRKRKPSSIPRPQRAPRILAGNPVGTTIPLRLRDPDAPSSRGMPRDVQAATIFTFVGEFPPASRDDWSLGKGMSRANFDLQFPATLAPGTKVWITAQYYNNRGAGPFAEPVYAYLGYSVGIGKVSLAA
jgi:hypothetical protein